MRSSVLLITLLLASSHLCAQPAAEADVIGRVGEHVISVQDVRNAVSALAPHERESMGNDTAVMNQLVRSLMVQNLVLQEALAKKWDQEPALVPYLARMRDTAITESYLQSICAPPATYPNQAELQAAYDVSKAALLVPRSYHLAQIFVASPKGAAADGKITERLDSLKRALKATGADFSALAGLHSDERESAGRGGDLGWLAESQIQPEIRSQLASLKLNTVSDPIRLDDGWHVLKVIDIREPFTPTLEQVKVRLVQQLRTERTRANTKEYLAGLMQANPIAINELALSQILPPAKTK